MSTPSNIRHALSVTREADFAAWYQEVISEAEMAEMQAKLDKLGK